MNTVHLIAHAIAHHYPDNETEELIVKDLEIIKDEDPKYTDEEAFNDYANNILQIIKSWYENKWGENCNLNIVVRKINDFHWEIEVEDTATAYEEPPIIGEGTIYVSKNFLREDNYGKS